MKSIEHKRGDYWYFVLNSIEFKCLEERFIRIFQGWKGKCIEYNGTVSLIFYKQELEKHHVRKANK